MSASREKKQRQGATVSERTVQAQQEQAVRKRKTITYTVIGVVVAVLVAALLIWNSGFFQRRATAATVGGQNISVAEMSYYYYGLRSNYAYYSYYGLSNFDSSKSDSEQIYDEEAGTTWRDFLLESALTSAQENLALYDQAIAAGHTASEVKDSLNSTISSVKSSASASGYGYAAYLRASYGPYMTTGTYEKLVTRDLLADLARNDKYDELFDGYTQDELDQYYADNADSLDTFEYSYLNFAAETVETTDADGNELDEDTVASLKEQAMADAKAKADAALAAYKDGASVADLITQSEPSSSADHTTAVGSTDINSTYREQLLALDEDEAELVESSTSYFVIVYHGRSLVTTPPTRDVRHILIQAETTTDDEGNIVAPTDEAWAAAKEKIDSIQAEYEAGDKTEDSFAALANKYSDDGDGTTGGLYERIANTDGYVPEFLNWIFENGRQADDVGLVQHEGDTASTNPYWGYHLIYLVGDNEPLWMRSARQAMATNGRTDWLSELKENSYTASLADGADKLGA